MILVPHQLVGIPLTYNATLECIVEAHPTSLTFWCRENEKIMIYDSQKYKYEHSSTFLPAVLHLTDKINFWLSLHEKIKNMNCTLKDWNFVEYAIVQEHNEAYDKQHTALWLWNL